ncbi:MAG: transmembrane protein [Ignavibacteria bacterium]|nr:MAG: transmembrane protein [Ignavibacteria bacterium]KAF0159867.1 MAG: transmembrane protein [Ignavibacteria bacterium]
MARGVHSRIIIGIMLVLVGAMLFLRNSEFLDFMIPDFFYQWEVIFVIFGLLFITLAKNKTVGSVFVAIGLFSLYPGLWPLVFVAIGAYIIFGFKFNSKPPEEGNDFAARNNQIEQVNIFGGGNKFVTAESFKGGSIVSIFGGSEVNLTGSKLAEGDNVLETISIFGGCTIIVPKDWNVLIDVFPLFGGFSDSRLRDPNQVYEPNKTLLIKGIALFGGGEVKTLF